MPTGLQRRSGGRYSLRRRVPADLIGIYGKSSLVLALGTSDPREARVRLAREWVRLDAEFARKRLQLAADKPVERPATYGQGGYLESLPQEIFEAQLRLMEEQGDENARLDFEAEERQPERDEIRRLLKRPVSELSQKEIAIREVLETLQEELVTARQLGVSVAGGATPIEDVAVVPSPTASVSFPALIDRWAKERRVQPKSKAAAAAAVRWFTDRGGPTIPSDITRTHIRSFKDALVDEGVNPANIEVKLRRVSTLLSYAYTNDLIPSDVSGIKIAVRPEDRLQRKPYDESSLKALFGGPVHATGQRPARGRGEAAYWLPLLALYSGARLEELAQLRPIDIENVRYRGADDAYESDWFIKIDVTADGGQKLKNLSSRRVIPVHAKLQELGFVEYASKSALRGDAALFPELKPDGRGRVGTKWGEWFSVYRREVCGVIDPALTFHSFRHTFARNGRDSDMDAGALRRLMGHSARDISDEYGKGYGHHRLVQEMTKYRVPGFSLPPSP